MDRGSSFRRYELAVLLVAAAIFIGCIVSPPALMDDVDSVQANIARAMLRTGDWVTPHLDGIRYFEKPPLKYWLIASSFATFGVHDWAARLPLALIDVLLCWLTFRFGAWAFGSRAGGYAGLILSTSVGLFLFTRVLIADSQLTFSIVLALWSFLRALDDEESRPRMWALLFWASIALAVLFKGLIGALFPLAAAFLFLLFTKRFTSRLTWRRLNLAWGLLAFLAIALPWHVLATIRNPPYFRFSFESGPGNYRGFFWFYFFNEHILRFLNRRYPRDYDTVPRLAFWLLNLVWLFPWTTYLGTLFKRSAEADTRASRTRLLAWGLCGFVMIFFTFSSTQEYYSMPIYPAVALLLASRLNQQTKAFRVGTLVLASICGAASLVMLGILVQVWNTATPGDISNALHQDTTSTYTLSLGHMGDLTLASFAYLRTPLMLAMAATTLGTVSMLVMKNSRKIFAIAAMMVVFFHAARLALIAFDPYLSSRPLADALLHSPRGKLIVTDQYYSFSSVLFYAGMNAYLLNGKVNNLEYGSNAPGAPRVFINNAGLARLWRGPERMYLVADHEFMPSIQAVIGPKSYTVVKESGGKYLIANIPAG